MVMMIMALKIRTIMVKMKIVMMVELVLHAPPLITDQIMMMMEMRMMVDPIFMLLPCFLIKSLLFLHDDDNDHHHHHGQGEGI